MQARGNAPQRASGTARYGLRWHARDRARSARAWLARASVPEMVGTTWVACGTLVLAVCAGTPAGTWYVPGGVMALAGAGLLAVARLRRRRR
jgi:hypothetical protein